MKMLLLLISYWVAVAALAEENSIKLKDGPGKDVVLSNCVMCHSLDYIPMNSGFLDKQGWQKSVDKMIKVMAAPIDPKDVEPIVDYLTANYGTLMRRGED